MTRTGVKYDIISHVAVFAIENVERIITMRTLFITAFGYASGAAY